MYVTNTIQITLTIFVEYHEIAIICHTKFTNNRKTPWRIGTFELKLKIGSRRVQIGPHQPIEANGTKAKWGEMGSNGAKWGKRCKLVPNGAKRGQNVLNLRSSDKNQPSYGDFVIFWNIIGPHLKPCALSCTCTYLYGSILSRGFKFLGTPFIIQY